MTSFPQKILAVHAALDAAGIEHAFGGALALAYHVGSPRSTADIDVNVSMPVRAAARVLRALPEEVVTTRADARTIARDGQVRVYWGRNPIDLFFPQHELHDVVRRRVESQPFADGQIPVLSATDLTIFKALFDRPKDWVDIGDMLAFGTVDTAEVRRWLAVIVGADDRRLARFGDQ